MEKLTRKVGSTYAVEMPSEIVDAFTAHKKLKDGFKMCCEKLGKLEDLEEQIGLSLDFIFNKVIGNDIYHIYENDVVFCEQAVGIEHDHVPFDDELGDWQITTDCCWKFKPSEYGISWWLDEDEAEKVLEKIKSDHSLPRKPIYEHAPEPSKAYEYDCPSCGCMLSVNCIPTSATCDWCGQLIDLSSLKTKKV